MSMQDHQPTGTPRLSPDEALVQFADAQASPEMRSDALTALITAKVLPKQADHPAISAGRLLLLRQIFDAVEPGYRLLGIAESVRLAQVVKRWSTDLAAQLRPAFTAELPTMQLMASADDRLNMARACALMEAAWLPSYLARSVAEEEAGEKARAELVAALFARQPNLAAGFSALARAFAAQRPDTEAPGDTIARRLTRTLSSVREVLLDNELEAGDGLGAAIHDLVASPLVEIGRPQEDKVRVDLSREALLTVHDLVRTRISVVADAEMYRVASYCRRLCGGSVWPRELKRPLDRLTADVTEAILLLGRQGQCHQSLIDQLDVLCDHPERARVVAKDLAAKHPELPEEVRDWLDRGRRRVVKMASDAALEAAASNADESIGLALQAARQVRQAGESIRAPLAASLEIYEPNLAPAAAELIDRVRVLAVQIEQAAQLRGLGLFGTVGEEVDTSMKFFNTTTGESRPRMTVLQPAIVRLRADGTPGEVVTKGLVQ
nr:hypothetical protein [uncultured Roseateles sp.]